MHDAIFLSMTRLDYKIRVYFINARTTIEIQDNKSAYQKQREIFYETKKCFNNLICFLRQVLVNIQIKDNEKIMNYKNIGRNSALSG